MLVKVFPGITEHEINSKTELTPVLLQSLKWHCLNNGKLKGLTKRQFKQLAAYMVKEAEEYSSSHSMRYTILKDFLKASDLIK